MHKLAIYSIQYFPLRFGLFEEIVDKFVTVNKIHFTFVSHSFDFFVLKRVYFNSVKLRCDERFTHAFTACSCVFKEITLVGSNQGNYFEN